MATKGTIQRLVNRLVENLHPEQVILFGSHAWGNPRKDSDVDLFVVQETSLPSRQRRLNARRFLSNEDVAVDVLVYTPEEIKFEQETGVFVNKVMRDGKLLYDKKTRA